MQINNSLKSSAVVIQGLPLSCPAVIGWFIAFLLHVPINAHCKIAELLGLQKGRGAYKVAMEEDSEVADGLLEVSVGKFGDIG